MRIFKRKFLKGLKRLDNKRFLGIDFWEFGLRSLSRKVGWKILTKIFFLHPIRSIKALSLYKEGNICILDYIEESNLLNTDIIIGGYCQKPTMTQCPAGHFTHFCYYAETLKMEKSCKKCSLLPLVNMAIKHNKAIYIMTTAEDLIDDIFYPGIIGCLPFKRYLTFICAYTAHLFYFASIVANINGSFFYYIKGACKNYKEFLIAEKGIKKKQTSISCNFHIDGYKLKPMQRVKRFYLPGVESERYRFED